MAGAPGDRPEEPPVPGGKTSALANNPCVGWICEVIVVRTCRTDVVMLSAAEAEALRPTAVSTSVRR